MDKAIMQKGDFKMTLVKGELVLLLDTKGMDITVKFEMDYFLDELADAIKGDIDKPFIEIIKTVLKGM